MLKKYRHNGDIDIIEEHHFDSSCRLNLLVSIRVIQLYYHSYINLAKVCPTNSKCRLKGGRCQIEGSNSGGNVSKRTAEMRTCCSDGGREQKNRPIDET